MSERMTVRLGTSMQGRVAGVNLGLIAVKPDDRDPEALIGAFNPRTGSPEQHRVRPGHRFEVAGRTFEVIAITPAGSTKVELAVRWDERS